MIIIREYADEIEAQIAQSVLDANGVPAVVLRDNGGGMLPSMQFVFPIRLAVREEDADLARHLLDTPFDDDIDDPLDFDVPSGRGPS